MKNLTPVLILIGIVVVAGGFYMVLGNKSSSSSPKTTNTLSPTPSKASNPFTSIKDALSKSVSLECHYKTEAGMESTTYIKAGSIRVKTGQDSTSDVIMKDKKLYTWNAQTKKGYIMTMPDLDLSKITPKVTVSKSPSQQPAGDQAKSYLDAIEKMKDSCKPAVVADSLFVPPTDVNFQDLSEMMKGIDVEKMKQQYMNK